MIRYLPLIVLAAPLSAQSFDLPAECSAYLTIQGKSCTVSHHFTCEGDDEGLQRRVDIEDTGLAYVGAIDAEAQWVASAYVQSGFSNELAPDNPDPQSLTELFDTGIDTFEFSTISPERGETRYVGFDTITGETVEIDGVLLERSTYDVRAFDAEGNEMWHAVGREFVSRDWRMFLPGVGETRVGEDVFESDNTPVEFIFPDEPGFLSENPKYGCGASDASFQVEAG